MSPRRRRASRGSPRGIRNAARLVGDDGLPIEQEASGEGGTPAGTVELAVASRFFEARIDVIAEGLRLSQFTLFERDDEGRTRIVRRTRDTL